MDQPEETGAPRSEAAPDGGVVADWMTVPFDRVKDDLFAARLRQARIPKKYLTKTLAGFHADTKARKQVVHDAREYVSYFRGHRGRLIDGIMLKGTVGSGKTHVGIGILREIIADGFTGLYCNVPEFFKDIRASYGATTGPDESDLIDETREADLLVLDDLGVEGRILDPVRDRSRWLCERLYLIVNGRYETDKPVIVVTNCSLDALTEQFDQRTVSRLAEMTNRRFSDFPDVDYRRASLR
jgi:DNA replication protein DnaC